MSKPEKGVYPFTQEEFERAAAEWGCNCGPSALAFALRQGLGVARWAIPDFERKGYTSPTMMKAALVNLEARFVPVSTPSLNAMYSDVWALVRIQFTGPWTAPGANARWAYTHTHWVCTWAIGCRPHIPMIFDCNGGAMLAADWEHDVVPHLIPKRGDGGWYPTHIWRLPR